MAARTKTGAWGNVELCSIPKKTRQGRGKHTKYASSPSNNRKKRYRGQGR